MTRAQIHKRFHELVVKEALSQITFAESVKLDRYQALLQPKTCADELKYRAHMEWQLRTLRKQIGKATFEYELLKPRLPTYEKAP